MRNRYSTLVKRKSLRRIFAAAFLLFLLAEWGAHAKIHIGSHLPLASSVSANQGTGDDPCHSFVHCRDGRHRDRQMPNLGHDVTPNVLVDLLPDLDPPIDVQVQSPIAFSHADGLSRPPDPAFHPPEFVLS